MENGKIVARTTVQRVIEDDLHQPVTKQRMAACDHAIKERMDDTDFHLPTPPSGLVLDDETDINDEPEEDCMKEHDDYSEETYDTYLGAELLIPSGDTFILRRVIKQIRDEDSHPIGRRHANPLLDMCQYEILFGDGSIALNLVAENMMAQSDPEGQRHMIFKEIVDHRKNSDAVSIAEGFIQGFNGNMHSKKTTKGWDISVKWRDGSTS